MFSLIERYSFEFFLVFITIRFSFYILGHSLCKWCVFLLKYHISRLIMPMCLLAGVTNLITHSRFSPISPVYIYMQYMLHIFPLVTDKQSVGRQWGHENTLFFIKIPSLSSSALAFIDDFCLNLSVLPQLQNYLFPTLATRPAHVIDKGNIFNASSTNQSNVLLSCLKSQPNNILKITLYDFCLRTFRMVLGQKH